MCYTISRMQTLKPLTPCMNLVLTSQMQTIKPRYEMGVPHNKQLN